MEKYLLVSFFAFASGCTQSNQKNGQKVNPVSSKLDKEVNLVDSVKLAINPQFQGWVLFSHGTYIIFYYGMYTYVGPSGFSSANPGDAQIGLLGRSKRALDAKDPIIKYVNRKNSTVR